MNLVDFNDFFLLPSDRIDVSVNYGDAVCLFNKK